MAEAGDVLKRLGFSPKLGTGDSASKWYFMKTDRWYLERRIYLAVGINISIASVLSMGVQPMEADVHGLRRLRDGVVCGHWFLHHGKWSLLARGRATAGTRSRSVG
jgi:hypothetical protein